MMFPDEDRLLIYGDVIETDDNVRYHDSFDDSDPDSDLDLNESNSLCSSSNNEPYLITLVRDRDWTEALTRLSTHPHEASYCNGTTHFTALHEACCIRDDDLREEITFSSCGGSSAPPIELVRSLLTASGPGIARARSDTGETPLCLLCASDAEKEEGEWNEKDGTTVNEIIRLFLEIDPKMATEECDLGWTALGHTRRAWTSYAWSDGGRKHIQSALHGNQNHQQQQSCGNNDNLVTTAASGPLDLTGTLRVLFDRIDILLHAAVHGKVRSKDDRSYSQLLHSSVSTIGGMPSSFVKVAAILCADQGYERDEKSGRCPLSIAASCEVMPIPSSTLAKDSDKYGSSTPKERGEIIETLISACPDTSCIADSCGRLPLQLALESGHHLVTTASGSGIQAILSDAPRALGTRDITTHFYPFMTAAISPVDGQDNSDLDTIYGLLRKDPLMAYGLAALDCDDDRGEVLKGKVKRLEAHRKHVMQENELLKLDADHSTRNSANKRQCRENDTNKTKGFSTIPENNGMAVVARSDIDRIITTNFI